MKVSVIVPVYNVGRYVERCAESLMSQTAKDVELIFVDDASTDGSRQIIESVIAKHPDRKDCVRIVTHDRNKGLPAARNTGLKFAKGEYILHCDGDDFVEKEMIEKMLRRAEETDADLVWCDWYLSFEGNERYMKQPNCKTSVEVVRAMLRGAMKYNVWNKLARRSLYDGIEFPEGRAMGEDMMMICVASNARKVVRVDEALYHYRRTNAEALTQNYSETKLEELKENTTATIGYLRNNWESEDLENNIACFCLNVKLPFLFTGKMVDMHRWGEWFPEANKWIMANGDQAMRTRLLQWCAAKRLYFVNKLYYALVYKVVYGKIYK